MKIFILLLSILVTINIFGAAESDAQFRQALIMQLDFQDVIATQDFDKVASFIAKNFDFMNKPDQNGNTFLTTVGSRFAGQKITNDYAFKIVQLLLELGADPLLVRDFDKSTIFHLIPYLVFKACEEIEKEKKELIRCLLAYTKLPTEIIELIKGYQSVELQQIKGRSILDSREAFYLETPLYRASYRSIDDVRTLIKYRADLEIMGAGFRTAIYSAITNPEILKLLIEAHANINHKSDGGTPLEQAEKFGALESVRILKQAIAEQKKNNQCCVIQ